MIGCFLTVCMQNSFEYTCALTFRGRGARHLYIALCFVRNMCVTSIHVPSPRNVRADVLSIHVPLHTCILKTCLSIHVGRCFEYTCALTNVQAYVYSKEPYIHTVKEQQQINIKNTALYTNDAHLILEM